MSKKINFIKVFKNSIIYPFHKGIIGFNIIFIILISISQSSSLLSEQKKEKNIINNQKAKIIQFIKNNPQAEEDKIRYKLLISNISEEEQQNLIQIFQKAKEQGETYASTIEDIPKVEINYATGGFIAWFISFILYLLLFAKNLNITSQITLKDYSKPSFAPFTHTAYLTSLSFLGSYLRIILIYLIIAIILSLTKIFLGKLTNYLSLILSVIFFVYLFLFMPIVAMLVVNGKA